MCKGYLLLCALFLNFDESPQYALYNKLLICCYLMLDYHNNFFFFLYFYFFTFLNYSNIL